MSGFRLARIHVDGPSPEKLSAWLSKHAELLSGFASIAALRTTDEATADQYRFPSLTPGRIQLLGIADELDRPVRRSTVIDPRGGTDRTRLRIRGSAALANRFGIAVLPDQVSVSQSGNLYRVTATTAVGLRARSWRIAYLQEHS